MTISVTMAPFPPLSWKEVLWEAADVLPSWRGFQTRQGPYTSLSSKAPSRGQVKLSIAVPVAADGTPALPSAAQRKAYAYLKQHERRVADVVQRRILRAYPRERREAIEALDELAGVLPVVRDVAGLRRVVGMGTVHLLQASRSGQAYVGFELGCNWDDEHGFGVMTHGARVVAHGHADHAFLEWVAERDAPKKPD